ncbi:hypothetical protein BPUM_1424 [Bacillus pumilus SAFR-032]|uniref:Uncharacterized protein n=1 Tax=Bacillus pumilus (strain SAFR-032) TaxID=315750 RepID=A8FCZ0_BACP2|nr:hypothetical protein BPUM_1424 [Bacillus pumilus SAFR-032]
MSFFFQKGLKARPEKSLSILDKNNNNPPKVLYHPQQELTDFHLMTVLYWYKQVQVLLLILCFR